MHRPLVPFVVLAAVATVALAAFLWPAAHLEPRGVPVGVVGAAPGALPAGDAFDVRRYADDSAARTAIGEREIYGAISGRTLYVASAASAAVAAGLRDAVPSGRVVDVVPASPRDPRGAVLGALALPLILIGIVTAVLAHFTSASLRARLGLLAGGAVIGGIIGAALTRSWLDALPGSWAAIAAAIGLVVLSVAATVSGLGSHLGRAGIGVGAVLMMLVGNPWSGITSAPEMLPEPAGTLGALLPAGAGGSLLRSVSFFEGAGGAEPLIVLLAWASAGLALMATAALRHRAREGQPARAAVVA